MKCVHHICIQTDCYRESVDFYKDILEFSLVKESSDFHKRAFNSWLRLGAFMIELQTNKSDEVLVEFDRHSKGIVHFCLMTDDIDLEYSRIKASGFDNFKKKSGQDIYQVEGGKLFKILAPEGTIIEFRDSSEI